MKTENLSIEAMIAAEVSAAEKRIRPWIRETLLDESVALNRLTGARTLLKCENLQLTGAFKIRGAMNKLLSLSDAQKLQGVVTASSGNHGAAVACGIQKLKLRGKVFVPENASSAKIDNIRNFGTEPEFFGTDCVQTEAHAQEYAIQHNMIYVPPYDDLQVIGGQGTIALEILRQLQSLENFRSLDAVFIPTGGGGLISGIAGYLKTFSPQTQIIGCLPENSPVMAECVKAGKIIEMEIHPTLSDGTAGGVKPHAMTFDFCRELVDEFLLVSEDEIAAAMITLIEMRHMLVEGSGAVPLAALIKHKKYFQGKTVGIILSGGNVSLKILRQVLDHQTSKAESAH